MEENKTHITSKEADKVICEKLITSFNAGNWHFQNNKDWVKELVEMRKTVSLSDKPGQQQYDFNFCNTELRIFLKFTLQEDQILKHYKFSNKKLRKIFETDILEKKSLIKYWEFENDNDKIPKYNFLYTNFNFMQRWRLAKAYRELLRKTLVKNAGGTTSDVYLSNNKQLFRESRLSNLLGKNKGNG